MTKTEVQHLTDLLGRKFAGIDKRFDQIDKRFAEVDRRFDEVDKRFDRIETRLVRVEVSMEEHRSDFRALGELVQIHGRRLDLLESR